MMTIWQLQRYRRQKFKFMKSILGLNNLVKDHPDQCILNNLKIRTQVTTSQLMLTITLSSMMSTMKRNSKVLTINPFIMMSILMRLKDYHLQGLKDQSKHLILIEVQLNIMQEKQLTSMKLSMKIMNLNTMKERTMSMLTKIITNKNTMK